jgi:hypothetical protein
MQDVQDFQDFQDIQDVQDVHNGQEVSVVHWGESVLSNMSMISY